MHVKIGEKIHDASKEPIMLILSKIDKDNIKNMTEESARYCCFPDSLSEDEVLKFMNHPSVHGLN